MERLVTPTTEVSMMSINQDKERIKQELKIGLIERYGNDLPFVNELLIKNGIEPVTEEEVAEVLAKLKAAPPAVREAAPVHEPKPSLMDFTPAPAKPKYKPQEIPEKTYPTEVARLLSEIAHWTESVKSLGDDPEYGKDREACRQLDVYATYGIMYLQEIKRCLPRKGLDPDKWMLKDKGTAAMLERTDVWPLIRFIRYECSHEETIRIQWLLRHHKTPHTNDAGKDLILFQITDYEATAKQLGRSVRSIQQLVGELVRVGAIQRIKRISKEPSVYSAGYWDYMRKGKIRRWYLIKRINDAFKTIKMESGVK